MGVIESKTGKVIRKNQKSESNGMVDKIVISENESGEQEMRVHVEMNDL